MSSEPGEFDGFLDEPPAPSTGGDLPSEQDEQPEEPDEATEEPTEDARESLQEFLTSAAQNGSNEELPPPPTAATSPMAAMQTAATSAPTLDDLRAVMLDPGWQASVPPPPDDYCDMVQFGDRLVPRAVVRLYQLGWRGWVG